jgi:tRNA (cmo5U34)-methyltransferase
MSEKKFAFDTISNFDSHISGSIKGYLLLDELIINISSFFAKKNETIIDFGCTSGRLISKLKYHYPDTECIGYDITDNNFLEISKAALKVQDITDENLKIKPINLGLCVFTLQFLTFYQRKKFLYKLYNSLNVNGGLIVCEKEISQYGQIQEILTFANYDYKKQNFTAEEILNKENDLRQIMNCLQFGGNETLLKSVGFSKVEPFFQSLNFRGWICIK